MPPLLPWGFAQELKERGATSLSGHRLAQIHFRVRIDRTPREQDSNQWVARVPSVMAARRGSMAETAAPCRVYELRRLLRTEMRGHCAGAVHRSRCSDRCRVCIRVRMRSVLSGALTHSPSCRPCLFELTCLCAVPATDRSSGSGFPFSARARARRRARGSWAGTRALFPFPVGRRLFIWARGDVGVGAQCVARPHPACMRERRGGSCAPLAARR